jgi:hypothetical protein
MRLTRPYWLLLGMLICLSGCGATPPSAPDSPRPPGQIPTPQGAPAEPTFKPDVPPQVPPRFMRNDRPLPSLARRETVSCLGLGAEPPVRARLALEGDA